MEELLADSRIYKMLEEHIAKIQEGMANYEKIKRFILTAKSFSLETGELTNTLKIKRAVVMEKYKQEIERMYETKMKPSC